MTPGPGNLPAPWEWALIALVCALLFGPLAYDFARSRIVRVDRWDRMRRHRRSVKRTRRANAVRAVRDERARRRAELDQLRWRR